MNNVMRTLEQLKCFYAEKLAKFGPTAQGVDWNSTETQELRFATLLKFFECNQPFSLIDYGCGYGALYDYMTRLNLNFNYLGLDLQPNMLETASRLYGNKANCSFELNNNFRGIKDYVLASGIFNVKFDCDIHEWEQHVISSLQHINSLSKKGFAFNCLTKYSDADRMRDYLYYGDPCFFFDYCKVNFSKNVALLHDYGLYEFTIIVRKF